MSTRFNWNVGSDQPEQSATVSSSEIYPSQSHRKTRFALTRGFIATYALALFAAAGGGFGLGRWSEARGVITFGVEGGLAVESLAWSDADIGLFEARLDPQAPPEWRADTLASFAREAPQTWTAHVVGISIDGETVNVELEVAVSGDGGAESEAPDGIARGAEAGVERSNSPETWLETRIYRSIGGSWVWREPRIGSVGANGD